MINWFPGHMNKSLREMQNNAKFCNAFVYVLDARAPMSSLNPSFVRFIGEKPVVYVLNKSDLADDRRTNEFRDYFSNLKNSRCVVLNAQVSKSSSAIISALKQLLKPLIDKNRANGVNFIFRAMVIGVPNCGKSTIVNNLCGKNRAITGNKPGVTKNVQWVKVDSNLEIMDSPGTLWPNFEKEEIGFNLAFIGSIKDLVVPLYDVALKLLQKIDFVKISKRYQIEEDEPRNMLENIARKRGCIVRGGEIDYDRVSLLFLNDFRKGAIGKITLECMNEINN